ncbi:MAG: hypothetical protein Q7R95_07695 [bacterium]|nr:hypothetical protein [bacterium]
MQEPGGDNIVAVKIGTASKPDTTEQIRKNQERIIKISTNKLSAFLKTKFESPILEIKEDNGPTHQTGIVDGKKTVILRPKSFIERGREIPTDRTIHEVAHCIEDDFLGLDLNRETDSVWYFGEGFAECITIDDPANIREELNIGKETGSYERIREEVVSNSTFGNTLQEYMRLDKLFAVRQPELEPDQLSESLDNKSMVPYNVGSSLVRFIIEKGGIDKLKAIMRKVQIQKKYAHGWEVAKNATLQELNNEEERVRNLLKESLNEQFGDVDAFEQEWRAAVLGKKN